MNLNIYRKFFVANSLCFRLTDKWLKILRWNRNKFSMPAPRYVKEQILLRYSNKTSVWVETGTYLGQTTSILAKHSRHVHSIEASKDLHYAAIKFFERDKRVTLHLGESKDVLSTILCAESTEEICFWLDAHFSEGQTYLGKEECPTLQELQIIERYLCRYKRVNILIDDIRCFSDPNNKAYPDVSVLIMWAGRNNLLWIIENDIMIMTK